MTHAQRTLSVFSGGSCVKNKKRGREVKTLCRQTLGQSLDMIVSLSVKENYNNCQMQLIFFWIHQKML